MDNLSFWRFTQLNPSTSSCSSFIFIKYNIEFFGLIDKIICLEEVDFIIAKKIFLLKNHHQVVKCNRHVINI